MATSAFALRKDPAYLDARRSGALARMQIHIVDDLGRDVPDAEVNVFMGMNFRPKGHYLKGVTDTNGIYVAVGKTCGDEIEISIGKFGYYPSKRKLCYATMGRERPVSDGKWQPYCDMQQMVLRKIRNPISTERFWKFRYTKAIHYHPIAA